jgi:hypothetical protein
MIKNLTLDQEKQLANQLYYGGSYTQKYNTGGLTPILSTSQIGEWAGQTGSYSDTQGNTVDMGDGGVEKTPDLTSGIVTAGIGLATAAIDEFDDDPGYGGADVGKATLQGAAMGANPALVAATGGLSILAGGAIGAGIGYLKKEKYEKEEDIKDFKKEQEKGYAMAMEDQKEFMGYAKGGNIKNIYHHGGETHPPVSSEVKPTKEDTVAAKKNHFEELSKDFKVYDPYAELVSVSDSHSGIAGGDISNPNAINQSGDIYTGMGIDAFQDSLTVAGLTPGIGVAADFINMGISTVRGGVDYMRGDMKGVKKNAANLAFHTAAAVPIYGQFASGSKLGSQILNKYGHTAQEMTKLAAQKGYYAYKYGKKVVAGSDVSKDEYKTGGMTQGAYNHSTNPLAVVDSKGNHTGMELTGGEGVFDKPAMDKIKTLLRGGKFEDVGAFVSNEMETWKHK